MHPRLAQALLLTVADVIAVVVGEVALRLFSRTAPQLELDIYRKQNGLLLLRPKIKRRAGGGPARAI